MSINRNRTKLNKAKTSREYTKIAKHYYHDYCYICAKRKRSGSFYIDCSPMRANGYHGNGKPVYVYKAREYKTWKYNRKTRWKE